jgi:hypothetical protein
MEDNTMSRNPLSIRKLILLSFGLFALTLATVTLRPKAAQANVEGGGSGPLHVTKNCLAFTGLPGTYCTITSSNIPQITVGTTVNYTQGAVVPTTPPTPNDESTRISLDSNVILYVGGGDWATGRCTLDAIGYGSGLCTFSDGIGPLTGFHAHVLVYSTDGVNYSWQGTYSFSPEPHE